MGVLDGSEDRSREKGSFGVNVHGASRCNQWVLWRSYSLP